MYNLLEIIRSMGYGALLGAGVLGLLRFLFPDFVDKSLDIYSTMAIGACIGAGLHQFLDKVVVRGILRPIGKFIRHYSKMVELSFHSKYISPELKNKISRKLIERHFTDLDDN